MKKKNDIYNVFGTALSLAVLAALAVCLCTWRMGRTSTTLPGFCAALLITILFALFCIRLIGAWMKEWRGLRPPRPRQPESEPDAGEPAEVADEIAETIVPIDEAPDTIAGPIAESCDEPAETDEMIPVPDVISGPTDESVPEPDETAEPGAAPPNALPDADAPLNVSFSTMAKIFLCGLAAAAAGLLLVYICQIIGGSRQSFWNAAQIWTRLDSQHYIAIARDWYLSEGDYGRIVQLVFLPGFPLVLRAVTALTGDYLLSGILISSFSFAGGCVVLYRLVLLDGDRSTALRAVKFAMLIPGAFFMASPMSDALFFLLSVSCMYCIRRKQWLLVGILGALASFTRTLGLVLMVPALYCIVTEIFATAGKGLSAKKILRFLPVLLMPAGFGAYCFICWQVSGNPLQFLIYQREHWGQTAGYFFNTAAYQTENAVRVFNSDNWKNLMGLWIPNIFCCFSAVTVMALSAKRLRPANSVYFMVYFAIAIGVTWLLSAPRYLASCFPICIGLAFLTKDRKWDTLVTVGLAVIYVLYAMMMANRWQVW